MKFFRYGALLLARLIAGIGGLTALLLTLSAILLWALGTHGLPLTVDLAKMLADEHLQVAHAEGGWFGPMQLEGVVIDTAQSRIEIDRLQLDWSPRLLLLRSVRIDQLDIGTLKITIKPSPSTPSKPLTPRLPFKLVLGEARLAHFVLQRGDEDGVLLALDDLTAAANWRGDVITLDHAQLSHALTGPIRAEAEVQLAPTLITLRRFAASGPATLTAQGHIGLMGATSALVASLKDAQWPLKGAAQVRLPQLQAEASGVLDSAARDLRLNFKGALRTAMAKQALGFDLDGALHLGAKDLRIEQLQLRSTDGAGSLSASGTAVWQPALRIDASAELKALNPGVLLPDWPGNLNGRIEAHTTGSTPEVRITAALSEATLRSYPLTLDAKAVVARQGAATRVQIDSFTLGSGSAMLKLSGSLLPSLDARATLDAGNLKTVAPELAGAVQLSVGAQGSWAAPTVQAKGSVQQFRFATTQISAADVDIDLSPRKVSRAQIDVGHAQFGSMRLASASLMAEGRLERHTLTLQASLGQPKATLALMLAGAAQADLQGWRGSLQSSSFTPPYGPAWQQQAPATLTLATAQQRLEPTCWQAGAARLCLDVTLAPPSTRLAYRLEALDTAAFEGLLPKDWLLQTTLAGQGEIALTGSAPQTVELRLAASSGRIGLPGMPTLALLPSTLEVRRQGEQWQAQGRLGVDRGTLEFEAAMPVTGGDALDRPLGGRVQLAVPELAWLTPLLPGVKDLRGSLDGRFAIAGSARAPRLEGGLYLREGSARLPAAGLLLKNVHAEAIGGSNGALILSAAAESGGGVLKLDGTADFASGTPVIELNIKGDNVQVADIADARAWASPDLVYAQNAEGMKLTGTVNVPKADITPRKLAANAVGASVDQVLVGSEAPKIKSLPLTAEVKVTLGEVSFEGFGLKSKLEGSVTALDTPGSGGTRGRGELRLKDAVYKAYGQEIEVQTGRILFNGGPIAEPTVDIVARRTPREDVSIALHVRGTLDQPTFDLSSSPAMPREQQLGWLLFGRPIDSGGAGGEFSGAAAALSLGIAGGDALANRIGKIVGLDQVSLAADETSKAWQPSAGTSPGAAGTDQTRFTVGKYLSPKLFVSYGIGLFDNGNVLRLLYDLGHGLKLRTESGLETGGDLLYSVEH